jgi:hypothetical protein
MTALRTEPGRYEAAEELLAALDAAPDDAARIALLGAAPRRVRETLQSELIYRKVMTDSSGECAAEAAAYAAFTRALDDAACDMARMAIIEAAERDPQRGPAWLAEWNWRRTATTEDWARRYFAAIGVEAQRSQPERSCEF